MKVLVVILALLLAASFAMKLKTSEMLEEYNARG